VKHIIWMLVGLALAAAPLAHADQWTKIFTISGKPELRVETTDANIRVDTWDKSTIDVQLTTQRWKIGEDGIKIYEHQTGDAVELEVRFPDRNVVFNFGGRRVDIDIHMPREGKVDLRTSDGHIRLANFKGEMQTESGDGHQDIDGVDGSLRAHAGDGSIRANGRFDALDLSTGDGHVEARALAGSKMAKSWRLDTGDGSVTLEVPHDLAADVDLRTGDGHITLDLPITVERKVAANSVRGKLNGGGNLLTIRTGDGSIHLEKS
jgi:Putative adhesin